MKKFLTLALTAVMALSLLTACGSKNDNSADTNTDGSNTETTLSGTVSTDGSTSMEKVINSLGESFMAMNKDVKFTYNPTGSGSGIQAVSEGRCDIGLSSRALKDDEKASGLKETTLALDEMVCADMRAYAPDCIVADSMAVWGKAVAKKLGIPFISSTTTFAFNRYSAKVMKQNGGQMLKMMLAMPKINRDLQRLRARGYPIKNILDIIQNDDQTDTIVYTSPEFQPCADTFSDKYAFVGPSIRPATENIEKTHDVLIYISMGTVNNDLLPFYRACIAAFVDSPYQVILSTGEQIDRSALGTLPDNITALPHVDQIAVLQKADVFLSHCGMNSASESLYFGVPLVLFPQTNEQGGVAARVAELGAGLKLEKADAASIRTAVNAVLQTPSYCANAQKIRESFLRCGGAKAAVDKILSVADRK